MTTTVPTARTSATVSWGRAARAGLLAGLAAAAAALAVFLVWSAATDREYEQLSAASIVIATLLAVTIGGLLYKVIAGRTQRPVRAFAALAVLGVLLEEGAAAAAAAQNDYDGGFLVITTILHVVVAATAVYLVPRLAGGGAGGRD
jgi:peptidoglycan/LPS O-acetylase OafA/YrhL